MYLIRKPTLPKHRVALVPGAAGLTSFWDPIREHLPADWEQQVFELPGFGPTPAQPDIQSYDDLVAHVAAGIPRSSVLAGQSMGGYIALELALRYPALVTHLVLIVAAGGVNMASHGAKDWRPGPSDPAPNATWTYAPVPDLTSELHRIRIPVQLIWATRDSLSPLGVAKKLAEQLPHARLLCIDSDDHWVARSHAAETARAITELVLSTP